MIESENEGRRLTLHVTENDSIRDKSFIISYGGGGQIFLVISWGRRRGERGGRKVENKSAMELSSLKKNVSASGSITCTFSRIMSPLTFFMSPTKGQGETYWFQCRSRWWRRQRDRFVPTISLEPVDGIPPNLSGYIIGTCLRAV